MKPPVQTVKKASQRSRPQARKTSNLFSPAACTSEESTAFKKLADRSKFFHPSNKKGRRAFLCLRGAHVPNLLSISSTRSPSSCPSSTILRMMDSAWSCVKPSL